MAKKPLFGEILISHNIINESQLIEALSLQKEQGGKLGEILLKKGVITEVELLTFLSEQLHVPFVDLRHFEINSNLIQLLPETICRRLKVGVLSETSSGYMLAMVDPTDLAASDEAESLLGRNIVTVIVKEEELNRVLDEVFRRTEEIKSFVAELEEELGGEVITGESDAEIALKEAPVVRLIDSIFSDAVQVGASDIHIEPDATSLRIRQRIDGVLHENIMDEGQVITALVSRLKIMAGLDISERRLPQDGRFSITLEGKKVDVRLSTMPVTYGESIVMRILDASSGLMHLEQLGMRQETLAKFKKHIHLPHGMVLVTGPTGSGKTTTLYAALNTINSPEKKIITIEDPVEYAISRLNQVQVHPKIDLTFSNVLRSSLRQDPDIIMVGEMRDAETIEIGLRSAITGHLVFSTLHTNDAIGSVVRLLDMGAEGFIVASAVRSILAQRLLRRICDFCKMPYQAKEEELIWLEEVLKADVNKMDLKIGKGCSRCGHSGYKGRIGVYEFLEIDEDMMQALRREDTALFAEVARSKPGYSTLQHEGLYWASQGVTSISEVLRTAGEL